MQTPPATRTCTGGPRAGELFAGRMRTGARAVLGAAAALLVALALCLPVHLRAQSAEPPGRAVARDVAAGRATGAGSRPDRRLPAHGPAWFEAGLRRGAALEERLRRGGRPAAAVRRRTAGGPRPGSVPHRWDLPGEREPGATTMGLVGGGLLGGAIGFAALGVGLPAMLCTGEPPQTHADCFLVGAILGGSVGETVGVGTGVHLAGGRRGSWLATTGASAGIGALGILAAAALQGDVGNAEAIILPLGVAGQLAGAVLAERATAVGAGDGPRP